jgi:anaerobic magnesium-protoporphyrin IX monomethyl ester cyclase
MNADITLINLNMLFIRCGEQTEQECHVPLGPLYLTRALEEAGHRVDFRDYQLCPAEDRFDLNVFLDFVGEPADVIGLSCMANLLPFTMLAARALRERFPDRRIILGGVGSKSVEEQVLQRFPWIDVICRGEAEICGPALLAALKRGEDLAAVPGISYRCGGKIKHTRRPPRIKELDAISLPAFEKVDLRSYAGYGMITSRGCPYPCTFCSVAPVWDWESYSRSPENVVSEMKMLHDTAGVKLFLFQDEFFVSGKKRVVEFCRALKDARLDIKWKAFGRVNLCDREMMQIMADHGCIELRFGIESGSDAVLKRIRKGFTAKQSIELISQAVDILPRVDAFFVWGFPFETMTDFYQSLFQMISFRSMGARILPSLLSLLPQTEIYREWVSKEALEFCPYLLPEFVLTGHEICSGIEVELPSRYQAYFDLILNNPDIFPGFFHIGLKSNILPKLEVLRQFAFYTKVLAGRTGRADAESCGAHSPGLSASQATTASL